MTGVGRTTADLRIGLALAASPAAAVLAFFVWDKAVWTLAEGQSAPSTVNELIWVLLIAYPPAMFATVLIGGPVWLVMHRLRMCGSPAFVGAGMLIATACFYFVLGHRRHYLTLPFGLAPVFAGACGGYVLHRVGYRNRVT